MDRSPEGFTTPRRERRVGDRSRHAPGGTLRRPIFPTREKKEEGRKEGRKERKAEPQMGAVRSSGRAGRRGGNPPRLPAHAVAEPGS